MVSSSLLTVNFTRLDFGYFEFGRRCDFRSIHQRSQGTNNTPKHNWSTSYQSCHPQLEYDLNSENSRSISSVAAEEVHIARKDHRLNPGQGNHQKIQMSTTPERLPEDIRQRW